MRAGYLFACLVFSPPHMGLALSVCDPAKHYQFEHLPCTATSFLLKPQKLFTVVVAGWRRSGYATSPWSLLTFIQLKLPKRCAAEELSSFSVEVTWSAYADVLPYLLRYPFFFEPELQGEPLMHCRLSARSI